MQQQDLDLLCGLTDEELDYRFTDAVRITNEIKCFKGTPISGWDAECKQAHLEYADGHREYYYNVG